jgi:hypothetical protein
MLPRQSLYLVVLWLVPFAAFVTETSILEKDGGEAQLIKIEIFPFHDKKLPIKSG